MARAPGESRIPVLRSGIPLAFGASKGRSGTQLPVRAARPTALAGLTAHWPPSAAQASSPASSTPSPSDSISALSGAHLGCEVIVGGTKPGILRYFGTLPFDAGLWCGVELHKPEGLNDGSVRGVRLFTCRSQHGVVAPEGKVRLLLPPANAGPPSPAASLPSGVKRQRTDSYESGGCASGGAEDEGSTPKEEEEQRWSEEETTPPAEQRRAASPLLCPRTVRLESPEEGDEQCPPISPASLPTPLTPRTLEWSQPKLGCGPGEEEEGEGLLAGHHQHHRSISDGSLCDMAGPATSSTPISASTPFSSARCARRGHPASGPKQPPSDTCSCGLGISKQSSFELDESLGILTPDQMVDFTLCVEAYGRTPPGEDAAAEGGRAFQEGGPVFPEDSRGGEKGEEGTAEEGHSDADEELDELRMEVKDVVGAPCGGAAVAPQPPDSAAAAPPPPRPTQVAPCFVASVTSITSIDPGYQGDGEWSRPASRADNSPGSTAPPGISAGLSVDVLKIKFETMTDSDFYSDTGAGGTESDADHEDGASRETAMAPGDRRAQVIDGTLYGGIAGQQGAGGIFGASHQQPQPRCFAAVMTSSTATTTEEMESSGVFSDLERRTDLSGHGGMASSSAGGADSSVEGCLRNSQGAFPRPSSAQGVTTAESSDVPQSPLEELPEDPKKDITLVMSDLSRALSIEKVDGEPCDSMDSTLVTAPREASPPEVSAEGAFHLSVAEPENPDVGRLRNSSCEETPLHTPTVAADSVVPPLSRPSSAGKKESTPDQVRSPRQKTPASPAVSTAPPKKYKMPKRNVASKIKAMIEASATKDEGSKDEPESRKQSRMQAQKKGRWDAIMSKIAAGQAEQRSSRPRLREVKSRVLAGINTTQANTDEAAEATPTTTRTKKPFVSNVTRARRAETRRTRARGLEISSLRDATCSNSVAAPPGGVGGSRNHSVHSSLSDVSVSQGGLSKASVSSRSSKKREAGRSASPFSDGSSNSGASNIPRPMAPFHGPLARQPPHPQRERTRDKAANPNALTMTSAPSAAVLRRNQRNNHLTSSSTPAPKRVVAAHRRSQTEKASVVEMKTPSARKPITRHLAPSGAQVQKPASMRDNNRLAAGVLNKNGSGTRGTTVVVVQRQQQHLPTVEPAAPETAIEVVPKAPVGPPPVPAKLLQELRHSASGVEALGVLVQYLVFDLEAYSTSHLKKMMESFKAENISTKLSLDEAIASCRRLAEAAEISEVRHKEDISELIQKHEEAMSELEIRLNSQIEETQCRYEEELKRRDRLSSRNTEALLEDVKLYAERAERAEKEKEELLAREENLKRLNSQLEKEITEMQEKFHQELTEVSRIGESGKLRDEIGSLQTVLDLRTKEMHEYRKKAEEWWHKSEALNSAVARAAALQARVEDLEAQLQRKVAGERKLQEKVRHLSESMERECRQNEQLALENEVLEWKVNESTKLMASLSGQSDVSSSMTGSMMASSSPSSDRRCVSAMAHSLGSPESPPAFMFPRFSPRLSPKSPFSDVSGTLELEEEEGDEEEEEEEEEEIEAKLSVEPNRITPKVRTLVEKNESISWLVEMEEVIPAALAIQGSAMRRAHRHPSPPLDLLPRLAQEPPAVAPGATSPSTSPTSSDPSSSMFCGKGLRKGAMPPSKKTRLERGKGGSHSTFTSTPIPAPPQTHNHHRHPRYHHQSRATSRLPPSVSPIGSSLRSRSVSTDSESLDREVSSPVGAAEHKAWRGGKSCNAWVERVPVLSVTTSVESKMDRREERSSDGLGTEEGDRGGEDEVVQMGAAGTGFEEGGAPSEGDRASPPRTKAVTPTGDRVPSKRSSPYCEDFSDQSPYHSKGDSNDCYLLTDDNSSSVELAIGMPKKQPSPPPAPQPAFHSPPNQGISMLHHHHHHHYQQQQHVLSSLCAHPHLSIKESAGEAMISEEISDDTQGESEDEDRREEKLLDSENDDIAEEGGVSCRRESPDGAAAASSAELRVAPECVEDSGVTKCNGSRGDPSVGNSLKLGQQVLSSSTPDSSHFAQTDSSAMDLSWSEDLELMPSESEV